MIFFRSLFFNIFLYLGIALASLVASLFLFFKDQYVLFLGRFLSHYVIWILKIFLNTKIEFKGLENLKKHEKFFVASAHQSMFETFALQIVINGPIFILKKELTKIPFFGWGLKKIGAIVIVRNTVTKENLNFFDRVKESVNKSNRPLLIFPQGTRIKYKEKVPFKKGVGRIYQTLEIPCVPVALNSGKVWPKNSFNKYPGKITISFLNPISPGLEKEKFIERLQTDIYKEIDLID
jgi:1-acyl-sn-glycerol-3-phosphate acyltransferase|tara:strand:- start:119 stop:826 length:708 start_codon:yes stop_codon:yes gene_type:complete